MEFQLRSIGVLHTPFMEKGTTPIQASRSDAVGQAEIYPEYVEGLRDLDGFSHIILVYYFHLSENYALVVKPFLDDEKRGLFATRYPCRPNPIGLSIVKLVECRKAILYLRGVDMLDGTPLLDIKPYVPEFDTRSQTRSGWLDKGKPC